LTIEGFLRIKKEALTSLPVFDEFYAKVGIFLDAIDPYGSTEALTLLMLLELLLLWLF